MTENVEITTVLLDLDGTIVLTDDLHLAAWNVAMESYDIEVSLAYYKEKIMGRSGDAIMSDLLPDHSQEIWNQVNNSKEEHFRAMVDELEPNEGFIRFLDWCDRTGMKVAVVTNAPKENAKLMLTGLGLNKRLSTIVIGDDLEHGKPHPLPYLTALSLLDASAENAIAFEDSLSGVQSASAAGIHTFGVLTALSPEVMLGAGADATISNFSDSKLWDYLEETQYVS